MKKLLTTIFIVTSLLVFTAVHNAFQMKDFSDISNNFGLNKHPRLFVEFANDTQKLKRETYIDVLKDISNKHGVTTLIVNTDHENKISDYYIYSNTPLNELFELTIQGLVLDDTDSVTLSSKSSDRSTKINMIEKDWTLNVHNISKLLDIDKLGLVSIHHEDDSILNLAQKDLSKKLESYAPQFLIMQQESFDYTAEISTNAKFIIGVSMALLVTSLLFYVSSSLKEISIYKLQGYPMYQIFKKFLVKDILVSIILALAVNALYFVLRVGFITIASKLMLVAFLKYFLILIGVLALISVLFMFVIQSFKLSSLLKGKSLNNFFATSIYLIKVVTVILIIPTVVGKIPNLLNDYQRSRIQSLNQEIFKDTTFIQGFKSNIKELEQHFFENSEETNNPEYINQQAMLVDLQEKGAYFMELGFFDDLYNISEEQFLMVDENYIEQFLTDFELINEPLTKDEAVLIVDKNLEKNNIDFSFFDKVYQAKIVYSDLPNHVFSDSQYNPRILLVLSLDSNRINKTFFNNIYMTNIDQEVIDEVVYKHGYEDRLEYASPFSGNVEFYALNRDTVMQMFTTTFLIIIVSVAFFIAYRNSNTQSINVKKLMGYNTISIYGDFLLETLLPYLLLFLLYKQELKISIIWILMIEISSIMIVLYINYSNPLARELKKGS